MTVTENDITSNAAAIAALINAATSKTIADLDAVTSLAAANLLHVSVSGIDKKIQRSNLNVEGTEIKSNGETGGTKYLREDGDGTCSWQAAVAGTTYLFLGVLVRGAQYVGTNITSTIQAGVACTLTKVIASVDSAPTGTALELNMQKNGANDVLSTELSIAATATSGSSTDIDTDYDNFAEGDYATLDVSQVGSTLPGTTLRVLMIFTQD